MSESGIDTSGRSKESKGNGVGVRDDQQRSTWSSAWGPGGIVDILASASTEWQ